MRRKDFLRTEPSFFQEVARRCPVGYLGLLTPGGFPRSVALNFAACEDRIYFHGALAGQKFQILDQKPAVGFTMAWELSTIPSSWIGPRYACPATQLFQSVEIQGAAEVVIDRAEKAAGLQALMEKYQPEGGFDPIEPTAALYQKTLVETGVFRITAQSWTGKERLYQEKPEAFRRKIMAHLKERGRPLDLLTIAAMEA